MAIKTPVVLDTSSSGIGALQPGDSIPTNLVVSSYIANANIAIDRLVALDNSNPGKIVLCNATLDTSTSYVRLGIAITAGNTNSVIQVAESGEVTLSTNHFIASEIGQNVFASTLLAGLYSTTEPKNTGTAYVLVGKVSGLNKIILAGANAAAYVLQ